MPDAVTVVEKFLAHVHAGEWSALPDLYADDAVVDVVFAKPLVRLAGRDTIRKHLDRAAGIPIRFQVERLQIHRTGAPDTVIAEFEYVVNGTRLGNVQVFELRDGLIARTRDYHDHAGIAAALRR